MRKKTGLKIIAFGIAAFTMTPVMAACGGNGGEKETTAASTTEAATTTTTTTAQASGTKIIKDQLGREVEISADVKKIVPIGNTPRMITYLGLADNVVGYGGIDDDMINPVGAYAYVTRDKWRSLPKVGTDTMGNTDYYPEEMIKTGADVILCSYTADVADELQQKTGIPVVAVSQGTLFQEDYDEALRILGEVCNVSDRAEEVIKYVKDNLADLQKRTADVSATNAPTVLEAAATFKGSHGIEGVRLSDPVLSIIKANNVAEGEASGKQQTAEVDKEKIIQWNPDYIFCDYSGVGLVKQDLKENPGYYERLTAFNEGKVYQHPSSTFYFTNLEISLANAYYCGSVVYPDKFGDIDITDKANEIFKFFLGEDNYMKTLEEAGAGYGRINFDK